MKQEVLEILKKYNQEHILKFEHLLTLEEKENLEKQILKIDFTKLKQLYDSAQKTPDIQEKKIEHIPYVDKEKMSKEKIEQLEQLGKEIIVSGKYAVITMAGGQGTRLGHSRTKRNLCFKNSKWHKIHI